MYFGPLTWFDSASSSMGKHVFEHGGRCNMLECIFVLDRVSIMYQSNNEVGDVFL